MNSVNGCVAFSSCDVAPLATSSSMMALLPVPRATDDEFDPPVRMDSSDEEDTAPPVPPATRVDSSDDEREAYYIDNLD